MANKFCVIPSVQALAYGATYMYRKGAYDMTHKKLFGVCIAEIDKGGGWWLFDAETKRRKISKTKIMQCYDSMFWLVKLNLYDPF